SRWVLSPRSGKDEGGDASERHLQRHLGQLELSRLIVYPALFLALSQRARAQRKDLTCVSSFMGSKRLKKVCWESCWSMAKPSLPSTVLLTRSKAADPIHSKRPLSPVTCLCTSRGRSATNQRCGRNLRSSRRTSALWPMLRSSSP